MAEDAGYRQLEVYEIATSLAVRIHAMSLRLPSFELFEEGSQIRKSSKSASSQIVEGYGHRKYRDGFLDYLHRAKGSADETRHHLDLLHKTGSLKDDSEYSSLASECDELTAKLGAFINSVERNHTLPYYLRPKQEGGRPPISNP